MCTPHFIPSIYGKTREKILCPLFWLPTEKPGRRNPLSWFTSEFRLFFRQQWCILFQHPPCGFLRVSLDKTHGHCYLLSVTWVIKPAASSNSHVQSEEGDSTLQSWCISETMREMITKLWFLLKCISHLYFVFVYFGAAEASSCSPIVLNRYRPQTSRPVSQCCLFSYNKQDIIQVPWVLSAALKCYWGDRLDPVRTFPVLQQSRLKWVKLIYWLQITQLCLSLSADQGSEGFRKIATWEKKVPSM